MSSQNEESSAVQATAKKLEKLHNIERVKFKNARMVLTLCVLIQDIIKMLGLAAGAIEELSKESPSAEVVEYKTKDFVKTLEVSVTRVCIGIIGKGQYEHK